jgi:hypothetical protein
VLLAVEELERELAQARTVLSGFDMGFLGFSVFFFFYEGLIRG